MRQILPLIILVLFFLADIYIFQAVKLSFRDSQTGWRKLAYFAYWIICITVYIGIAAFIISTSQGFELNKVLRVSFSVLFFGYFIFKLFSLPLLVADDFFRLGKLTLNTLGSESGFDTGRSKFLSRLAIVLGALPFLTIINGSLRNVHNYKIRKVSLKLKSLPKSLNGLKIIQLSDIHSGSLVRKKPIQKIVNRINELNPDLIFFTGDLVNYEHSEILPFKDIFAQLKAKYGVYSVKGNHDYGHYVRSSNFNQAANKKAFEQVHADMGWDLLLNEHRQIEINGENVAVIGVENWSSGGFGKYGDLGKAYEGCNDCALKLLLSHDPSHWREVTIKEFKDIDLTFSGHTHGMQFGIDMKNFKWSPVQYVYRDWAGLSTVESQSLYVNRGFGVLGYYGRVGIHPEITVISLESVG